MQKKDLILNALQELLTEQKGAACSVNDIAKKAGIAKGGMYYYFKSKEEVFDALVDRTYRDILEQCRQSVAECGSGALDKLKLLYLKYRSTVVSSDLDSYLHQPQNAEIHQKSLAKILNGLSPLVAQILRQGVEEKVFRCDFPDEVGEIILSVFCFLMDPGIFHWTPEQSVRKLKALALLVEKGLETEEGSMSFFYGGQ